MCNFFPLCWIAALHHKITVVSSVLAELNKHR